MKTTFSRRVRRPLRLFILAFALGIIAMTPARAGLTFDLRLIREQQGQSYNFYAEFYTNSTPPAAALGTYQINSPQQPASGSWRKLELTSNGFIFIGGGSSSYGDLNSVMNQITNGNWTIVFTNATTTNHFQFTVGAPNMTSNMLPALIVTSPTAGVTLPTTQPTFTWQWPGGWGANSDAFVFNNDFSFFQYASLPEAQNTWFMSPPLPTGENLYLQLRYTTNYTTPPLFAATTPLETNSAQPISGWISASGMTSIETVDFTVTNAVSAGGAHTLVAHYAFDDGGNSGLDLSGNGNDFGCGSGWGPGAAFSTDAIAGGGAISFFGGSSLTPCGQGQAFTSWTNTFAGSFTVSAWLKTTNVVGHDGDDLRDNNGQSIIYADNNNLGATPVALTGSKVAFRTTDPSGNDDTLHSLQSVTTGSYVHIVSTRDQSTGEKKIYINGTLDSSDVASTESLSGCQYVSIGGELSSAYHGLVDDVQIYTGVLSAGEVQQLYNHPGTVMPDSTGRVITAPLVGRYDFEDTNSPGIDSSGQRNDANCGSGTGSTNNLDTFSTNAAAGSFAREYFGNNGICFTPNGDACFNNLSNALYGSFSLSAWISTTNSVNADFAHAYFGAPIWFEYGDDVNETILSITGSKAAFTVGNPNGGPTTTLHSTTSVNDGHYHLITATRNSTNGIMNIYVDGNLEATGTSTNGPRVATANMYIAGGYFGFYNGLLDDVRVYGGELSANDVATLAGHPLTNQYPVSVDLQFHISRVQDNGAEYYSGSVSFNSVSPEATTTNTALSPHGFYSAEQYPGGGNGSSQLSSSLGEVLNEFTNGFWKIYINQGSPTQQVYSFQASISGLDSNLLKPIIVFSPTNGAVNVATNPVFYWSGPTNFSTLVVDLLSGPAIFPPVDTTNWPAAPKLNYGSDRFDVGYGSNNFPGVTFTMPVEDSTSAPLQSWSAAVNLYSRAFTYFTVGAPAALPVQLLNFHSSGGNSQFSFQTLAGRPHTVQARTNLSTGTWIDLSNFVGNGALKTISITNSVFGGAKQGFIRVSTQ
ncbi:MAG: LamG domain-containing protein [Verrucomicrobiota bacterium]